MRRVLLILCLVLAPAFTYAADADVPGLQPSDHLRGRTTAPVTLIVYSDFACSFCKAYASTLTQLIRQTHGKVNVAERPFPLSFHPQAVPAAQAAACAAEQAGEPGFWRMHDSLFAAQKLEVATYSQLAASQSLNPAAFASCMHNASRTEELQHAAQNARDMGLIGTPTTFIQQRTHRPAWRVDGAVTAAELLTVIRPLWQAESGK